MPFCLVQVRKLLETFREIGFTDDRIPAIYTLGFVAGELHGDGSRYSRPFEIAYSGSPEVMGNAAWYSGFLAGQLPRLPKIFDWTALPMKDQSNRLTGGKLKIHGQGPLLP